MARVFVYNKPMKTLFYTCRGDKGKSQVGGKKFSKALPMLELLGSLDELNSAAGLARVSARGKSAKLNSKILRIQEILFIAQAEVAASALGFPKPKNPIAVAHVGELEKIIGEIDKNLPPLKNFVVPGGSELASRLDLVRTAARRTERMAVKLSENKQKISGEILKFLNRLSSAFFALARMANKLEGVREQHPRYS
jgi:cob(I)alamin adenosyltransferase